MTQFYLVFKYGPMLANGPVTKCHFLRDVMCLIERVMLAS